MKVDHRVVTPDGAELKGWTWSVAPDLLWRLTGRAERALDFAMCPDYPSGSIIEFRLHDGADQVVCSWVIVRCGWFGTTDGGSVSKPGSALVKPLGHERLETAFDRAGLVQGYVECANPDLIQAAWQALIDTGECGLLPDWYKQRAAELIRSGVCVKRKRR